MKEEAYIQYVQESGNWLHVGRALLIQRMLDWFSVADSNERSTTILEVGAGAGQNIEVLGRYGRVEVTEKDPNGVDQLTRQHPDTKVYPEFIPFTLDIHYGIACAFDVIEHIEDDRGAVQWLVEHLQPGGIVLLTVPAGPWFFTDHDVALGHYRRYTQSALRGLVPDSCDLLYLSHYNTLLLPFAVITRIIWQLKRRLLYGGKAAGKQGSPTRGPLNEFLSRILAWDVSRMKASSRRGIGLSLCMCLRKRM